MRTFRAAVAITCLCASACAGETRSRPLEPRVAPHTDREPLPMPDTAFRGDEAPATRGDAPSLRSRFETRSIGTDAPRTSRFHGAPVDLDVKGADLQDVFRLLADVGRVNIVVAGEVTGTVTLRLRHVPWDQALDVVARAKGLVLEREGNVILVRALGAHAADGARASN